MMAPTAKDVLKAVKASGVRYVLEDGWDDQTIAARQGAWDPQYVILHHTANSGADGNAPSLNWMMHDEYAPIRACHFLVARDGLVHVVYAYACYHAGDGGPGHWGNGPGVQAGAMNRHAYGIEIESKGTAKRPTKADPANGYTHAQVDATAKLTAQLLALVHGNTKRAINHRTWAPGRKTDTLRTDRWWHRRIRPYRKALRRKR